MTLLGIGENALANVSICAPLTLFFLEVFLTRLCSP